MIITYILIIVNTLLAAGLYLRKRRANSPFQIFFIILIITAILPGIFHTDLGIYQFHPFSSSIMINSKTILMAHQIILMQLVVFWIVEMLIPTKSMNEITTKHYLGSIILYNYVIALILIVLFYLYYSGIMQIMAEQDLNDLREGNTANISLILFYLQIMIVGLPAYYIFVQRNIHIGILLLLLMFTIQFVFGGSRQVLFISIFLIVIFYRQKYTFLSSIAILLIFMVSLSAIDTTMQIAKLFRNTSGFEARLALIPDLLSGNKNLLGTSSEQIIVFPMYILLTEDLPEQFGKLRYLGRTLLFWLPSGLDFFSLKPADFEYETFAFIMNGKVGTMHATFFGSSFADAKEMSFLWVIFYTLYFRFMEWFTMRMRSAEYVMLWSTCVYFSVMAARGSLYAPLVVTALAIGLTYISSNFRKKTEKHPQN